MRVSLPSDPLDRLSWAERHRWRTTAARVTRAHEADQLTALRRMAGQRADVTSVGPFQPAPFVVGPVQIALALAIGRRRLIATRVERVAWTNLQGAWAAGGLALTGAGRYGPGWTLIFEGLAGRLVILAERLVLHPFDGGGPFGSLPPRPGPASRSSGVDCYPRGAKAPEPHTISTETICIGQ